MSSDSYDCLPGDRKLIRRRRVDGADAPTEDHVAALLLKRLRVGRRQRGSREPEPSEMPFPQPFTANRVCQSYADASRAQRESEISFFEYFVGVSIVFIGHLSRTSAFSASKVSHLSSHQQKIIIAAPKSSRAEFGELPSVEFELAGATSEGRAASGLDESVVIRYGCSARLRCALV